MKSNFVSELSKFVLKHKYLIFVAAFLAFILLFRTRFVIEGLTGMGEYEYLAPIPADNSISYDLMKAFLLKRGAKVTPDVIRGQQDWFKRFLTEKELQYYLDNGKWPYDGYVLNYINNHPDFFSKLPSNYTYKNLDDMQKDMGNRDVYGKFIMPQESQMNPPPLSYQIYMGTAQPPSSATTASNATSGSSSSSKSSSTTDPNYQDFLSLCKKALNK